MIPLYFKDNFPNDFNARSNPNCKATLKSLSGKPLGQLMENNEIITFPTSSQRAIDDIGNFEILHFEHDDIKDKDVVRTGNLVGFIGVGNVQINIQSRFCDSPKGENDFFLLHMLSKVMSFNLVNLETGSSNNKELDLLYCLFPRMLHEALSQGLYKQYIRKEYNDSNLKGVIDFPRHIRRNNPPNGRIAYHTREFSYDNDLTELIRHTIEFMGNNPFGKNILNNNQDTNWCVRQIVQATPGYQKGQRRAVIHANLRPFSHPYYTKYKPLQRLCMSILRHE